MMNGYHGIHTLQLWWMDDDLDEMLMIYGLLFGENCRSKNIYNNFTYPSRPDNDPSSAVDQFALSSLSLSITATTHHPTDQLP
jgi:hypothetical protein